MKYIFILCIWLCIQTVWAQKGGQAKIVSIKGKVEFYLEDKGQKVLLTSGDFLEKNYGIKTYQDGIVLLEMEDMTMVKIDPGSIIAIESLPKRNEKLIVGEGSFYLGSGAMTVQTNKKKMDKRGPLDTPITIKHKHIATISKKGTFIIGVDYEYNHLWINVKTGSLVVIDYQRDDYVDLSYGQTLFIERGNTIHHPEKHGWPLRINWQMENVKNYRMQSNFFALETSRLSEIKKITSNPNIREKNSYRLKNPKKYLELETKKEQADLKFSRFYREVKPEKFPIQNKQKSPNPSENREKGVLQF